MMTARATARHDTYDRRVTQSRDRWPFGESDGGPADRPVVVKLEGVLIAMVRDTAAADAAVRALRTLGIGERSIRCYSSEQIVAFDDEFRSNRNIAQRVVGAFVDDGGAMDQYVQYGRAGAGAVWVAVPERRDADRVVRALSDIDVLHVWYHGRGRAETLRLS
jgi:hypothetical protein